jgi:hypothetical protein
MAETPSLIPCEAIEGRILLLRGQTVILSPDLAKLYEVATRALFQAVRRNADRFPEDFMFPLTWEELGALQLRGWALKGRRGGPSRSQTVILNRGRNIKRTPFAFMQAPSCYRRERSHARH